MRHVALVTCPKKKRTSAELNSANTQKNQAKCSLCSLSFSFQFLFKALKKGNGQKPKHQHLFCSTPSLLIWRLDLYHVLAWCLCHPGVHKGGQRGRRWWVPGMGSKFWTSIWNGRGGSFTMHRFEVFEVITPEADNELHDVYMLLPCEEWKDGTKKKR